MTVHSLGHTTMMASFIFVIVGHHRVVWELSCKSMIDGLVWSQMSVQHGVDMDVHVDPPWVGIIYKKN
jgi:hypothetical protein